MILITKERTWIYMESTNKECNKFVMVAEYKTRNIILGHVMYLLRRSVRRFKKSWKIEGRLCISESFTNRKCKFHFTCREATALTIIFIQHTKHSSIRFVVRRMFCWLRNMLFSCEEILQLHCFHFLYVCDFGPDKIV